jgi:hypothetical protein
VQKKLPKIKEMKIVGIGLLKKIVNLITKATFASIGKIYGVEH